MVERTKRKHTVNPERKYIRLQEIGLAHFLSWPLALLFAGLNGLYAYQLAIISVLVCFSGIAFFSAGHIGRKELAQQREGQTNGNDNKDKP